MSKDCAASKAELPKSPFLELDVIYTLEKIYFYPPSLRFGEYHCNY